MKTCIACGVPMENVADFASGDLNKDYCIYCARTDGSTQSFDEKLAGYPGWLVKTQGLALNAARDQARTVLMQLPAWKNQ